jgi:hypothetical protein
MPGDPRNASRVDARTLMQEARTIGTETGNSPTAALEGLSQFVGKTGDLQTGRDTMKDLAVLSKATGTNLNDMVSAAGDVSNSLGDIPNKGKMIYEVMKATAGQGKLGAVEIRDMASQMAKLASNAMAFGGDVGENIKVLGAFAQEARQRGGASSATMAATSVASFVNILRTKKRMEAFEGITHNKVYDANNMLRDPRTLVLEALQATKGKIEPFKDIFKNSGGARAVEGFASIYRQAYAETKSERFDKGGSVGPRVDVEELALARASAAVTDEFDRLMKATMSDEEIAESFKRAMGTTESKVQVFNNKIAETVTALEGELIPALAGLAPLVLEFAQALSSAISESLTPKKKQAEGDIQTANIRSATNAALGSVNEQPLVRDPATGEWHAQVRHISPEMIDQNKAKRAELQRQLNEAQKDELAKREAFENKNSIPHGSMDPAELRKAMAGQYDLDTFQGVGAMFSKNAMQGPNEAASALDAQNRVASLQRDLDAAQRTGDVISERLQNGTLKVIIVEDKSARSTPMADGSGRAPANSEDLTSHE